ncbi:MAG: radical SAM protein [Candidatus Omnitrophota bacterium]
MFIVNDLGVNEPFGPMILSSVLKEKGHRTVLGVIKKEDVEKKILSWKPDMLAYSMMSVDMKDMRRFNDSLRKRARIFTILGGAHATLDRSCVTGGGIDAVCVGEGEGPIIDVVESIGSGKGVGAIPNIVTQEDPGLKLRPLICDLDTVPFMDRELVYSYPFMGRFGIKGIWTSRGCAFPCPYCFNNRYNRIFESSGRVVRRRTVSSVIEETKEMKNRYRVDFVRIQDDVFVYKADEWLKEFSERWASEIRLPFYCLLRAELVTDEMASYLKKAGCFSVCMSIEAADDDVRLRMMRRNATKPQLEEAFRIFKRHGINVYANTMLALPFTTLDHDIASLDFAIKVKPEMPNFSIFMPYPGTDLGDYCIERGIYDPEGDSIDYGMRNMSPLSCFSDREKRAQYNLCELAIVAAKFPSLRDIIVKRLIYWRPNKTFFFIHYLLAVTTYGRKIFYFRHTLKEYIELVIRTFRHYLYDFTKEKSAPERAGTQAKGRHALLSDAERRDELEKCMNAMRGA